MQQKQAVVKKQRQVAKNVGLQEHVKVFSGSTEELEKKIEEWLVKTGTQFEITHRLLAGIATDGSYAMCMLFYQAKA